MTSPTHHESKNKLLNSALNAIRAKGYSATTVDDICHAAGVTKGSFFHHFRTKDDLALAAAAHWSEMTEGLFAAAPYSSLADPLDRLLGYVDFRVGLLRGELPDYTCYLGTLLQEVYATHPAIIFAKAKQGPEVARESLAHLRRYLELQFAAANDAQPEESP